jgi:hypothetical protein
MPVLERIQADVGRFSNSLFVVLGVLGVFIDFPEDLDVCSWPGTCVGLGRELTWATPEDEVKVFGVIGPLWAVDNGDARGAAR